MKYYQILMSTEDASTPVVFEDARYARLSDALAALRLILEEVSTDPQGLDDTDIWVERVSGKKGQKPEGEEIVHVLYGIDEDTQDFCYEGIYYLTRCSDFENMILIGEKKGAFIGKYAVQISGANTSELCIFSDLEMIIESIKDLREQPEQICNRILSISKRRSASQVDLIGELLYVANKDGSLKLDSRLAKEIDAEDEKMLLDFIHDEQNRERNLVSA